MLTRYQVITAIQVEAIEVWMDGHPALKAGRALDAYADIVTSSQ